MKFLSPEMLGFMKVAIEEAARRNMKVILYDEPTTGLDPIRADVINELILKLQQQLKVRGC